MLVSFFWGGGRHGSHILQLQVYQGEFLPYIQALNSDWTGYYANRPQLKRLIRGCESLLRATDLTMPAALLSAPVTAMYVRDQKRRGMASQFRDEPQTHMHAAPGVLCALLGGGGE